jgi:hypothetical protein
MLQQGLRAVRHSCLYRATPLGVLVAKTNGNPFVFATRFTKG